MLLICPLNRATQEYITLIIFILLTYSNVNTRKYQASANIAKQKSAILKFIYTYINIKDKEVLENVISTLNREVDMTFGMKATPCMRYIS